MDIQGVMPETENTTNRQVFQTIHRFTPMSSVPMQDSQRQALDGPNR